MQRRHVVIIENLVAPAADHARSAFALTALLVAHGVLAAAQLSAPHVAIAVVATEAVFRLEAEKSVVTRVAKSRAADVLLTGALTVDNVANADGADRARPVTTAIFAAFFVIILEVPIKRLTRIANSSRDFGLASTQSPRWHVFASAQFEKVFGDSIGIAVTLFTQGIIIPLGRAFIALGINEVGFAGADAVVVARHAFGAQRVAVTRLTFRILVKSRRTRETLTTAEVAKTRTLTGLGIAYGVVGADVGTFARLTIGVAEPSGFAAIATFSAETLFANTLAIIFVTNFLNCSLIVAIATFAFGVAVKSVSTLVASSRAVIGHTGTLTRLPVARAAYGAHRITVALCIKT